MKKKIIGKIAALSLAGLTALPSLSIVSSAKVTQNSDGTVYGTVYVVMIANESGVDEPHYFTTAEKAAAAVGGSVSASSITNTASISTWGTIYVNKTTGEVVREKPADLTNYTTYAVSTSTANDVNGATPPSKGRYATNYSYRGDKTLKFYPSMEALYADGNSRAVEIVDLKPGTAWSTTFCYFDVTTGYYYNYPIEGRTYIVYYKGTDSGASTAGTVPSGYRYSDSVSYYSYTTHQYYPNLAALYAAVGYTTTNYSVHTLTQPYSSTYCYFDTSDGEYKSTSGTGRVLVNSGSGYYYGYWYSTYTNQYYTTYEAALKASQNASQVIPVDYYNGYYYGYNYNYPYYWYYYYGNSNNSSSSSSSSSSGTISITDSKSWTTLANRIKSTAAGKTISVEMNDQTIIPASVFTALKGKDVTVSLRLDNGVIYTINGKNVTSAKDVNVITTYNTDRVPTSLVKKAYQKYNAVSTAQITINSNSFGAKAGVTVKFATKRAGCTARLYRYNSDKRTLSLVDTSKVESTGKCTFEGVAKGGDFVIILS